VVSSRFVTSRPEGPEQKPSNKKRILPVPADVQAHGAERLPPAERS
jgi:hypothetical protein